MHSIMLFWLVATDVYKCIYISVAPRSLMMKCIFHFHVVSFSFCRLKLKRLKSFQLRFACDRSPVYACDNLTENVKCILTAECTINVFVHASFATALSINSDYSNTKNAIKQCTENMFVINRAMRINKLWETLHFRVMKSNWIFLYIVRNFSQKSKKYNNDIEIDLR